MFNRMWLGFVSGLVALTMLLSACSQGSEATSTPSAGGNATNTPAPGGATKPPAATQPPSGNKPTQPSGPETPVVRIGFAFVNSGDNAMYGKTQRQAAELAWHEIDDAGGINGAKIAAIFEDTASKPDKAVSAFQKLINVDAVLALVGPTLSNEAKSSDPEAQQASCPVLGISDATSDVTSLGDYIFRGS